MRALRRTALAGVWECLCPYCKGRAIFFSDYIEATEKDLASGTYTLPGVERYIVYCVECPRTFTGAIETPRQTANGSSWGNTDSDEAVGDMGSFPSNVVSDAKSS